MDNNNSRDLTDLGQLKQSITEKTLKICVALVMMTALMTVCITALS
mgnify:CR=1 FL=1